MTRPHRHPRPSLRPALRPLPALGLAAGLLLLTACGDSGTAPLASGPEPSAAAPSAAVPSAAATTPASTLEGPVVVFAAASLTKAFEQIATDFRAAHPDVTVTYNFGASSALAQQIVAGAPADVFAAASPATMKVVTDADDAGAPTVFVSNTLQIAVPTDNPGRVTGLADFAKEPLKIALCAAKVPCGAAAEKVFAASGITPAPDTLEQDVKAALSKVELGEVDAALVYRTDVLAAAGKVTGIEFPESAKAVNDYPIAPLTAAPNGEAAAAFVAHVLSPEGQKILADAGFERP